MTGSGGLASLCRKQRLWPLGRVYVPAAQGSWWQVIAECGTWEESGLGVGGW